MVKMRGCLIAMLEIRFLNERDNGGRTFVGLLLSFKCISFGRLQSTATTASWVGLKSDFKLGYTIPSLITQFQIES